MGLLQFLQSNMVVAASKPNNLLAKTLAVCRQKFPDLQTGQDDSFAAIHFLQHDSQVV